MCALVLQIEKLGNQMKEQRKEQRREAEKLVSEFIFPRASQNIFIGNKWIFSIGLWMGMWIIFVRWG